MEGLEIVKTPAIRYHIRQKFNELCENIRDLYKNNLPKEELNLQISWLSNKYKQETREYWAELIKRGEDEGSLDKSEHRGEVSETFSN